MVSPQHQYLSRGFLAIALGFLVVFGGAHAAKALTISPPSIEFTVQPGNQAEFIVKLYNEGTEKQELYMNATTFTAGPEEGIPAYDFSTPKEDIATWIQLDAKPVVLEPQAREKVTVAINVPADAAPGGHYGVVAFSSVPPTGTGADKPQLAISQGIGTLLLVRVEGEVVESADVTAFRTAKTMYNRLPAAFTTVYQNTGNIHLKPTGTVTITGLTKKTAATLTVNPTKTSTLPNSSRSYAVTWGDEGAVRATASNAWSRFWEEYSNERANFAIGKYTATLALTAGQSGSVVSNAAVSFWVLPWHILVVWIVGILVLIMLLIILVKRYNHWVVSKAQGTKNQTPPKEST